MWYWKIIIIIPLAIIAYQDCKDRLVYWFLYPIIGVVAFVIQIGYLPWKLVVLNSFMNLLFVALLLSISFIYLKVRELSLKNAIGLGDVLFFTFLSFGFVTITFVILFIFSLVFSLLLHFFIKHKSSFQTVPLAGYMSLFFGVVYAITLFCNTNFLYTF